MYVTMYTSDRYGKRFRLMLGSEGMKKKNPAAVELGRKGGLKKVPKGVSVLSDEERSERGRAAAQARWGTKKTKKGKKR